MIRSLPRRDLLIFGLLGLAASFVSVGLVGAPSYTDAFYHFNAAERLAAGYGLTDTYLWTYIGAPASLPDSGVVPSHLYWMPLTSILAGVGMALFGDSYGAATVIFVPLLWTMMLVAFWLGWQLGGSRRHAWLAGLLAVFNGFFIRFWGATDTFAPYAFAGSLCLVFLGLAHAQRKWHLWAFAGLFGGLGHLARADGLLLPFVGCCLLALDAARRRISMQSTVSFGSVLIGAYILMMLPWFLRNLSSVGSPLPIGGAQGVWFTEYNDLFNFPPIAPPEALLSNGPGLLLATRWEAFTNNLATFIAVEGWVIAAPFMLVGAWKLRSNRLVQPFLIYALGLHAAMTLVFPFPGYRGGLLHSAAALIPFWAALTVIGLDQVVERVARRRRHWNPATARRVFSTAMVAVAAGLTLMVASRGIVPGNAERPALYTELLERLPPESRILINDPSLLYYQTGFGGAVLPNAPADVIPELARRYRLTHVVIELDAQGRSLTTQPLLSLADDPPAFLEFIPIEYPSARLYAIRPEVFSSD